MFFRMTRIQAHRTARSARENDKQLAQMINDPFDVLATTLF